MQVAYETETRSPEILLGRVPREFAGQLATAVWLGELSCEAAREALWSYAMACHGGARPASTRMLEALMSEYRFRREWQDVCE